MPAPLLPAPLLPDRLGVPGLGLHRGLVLHPAPTVVLHRLVVVGCRRSRGSSRWSEGRRGRRTIVVVHSLVQLSPE